MLWYIRSGVFSYSSIGDRPSHIYMGTSLYAYGNLRRYMGWGEAIWDIPYSFVSYMHMGTSYMRIGTSHMHIGSSYMHMGNEAIWEVPYR
jgi:hypothetical protein